VDRRFGESQRGARMQLDEEQELPHAVVQDFDRRPGRFFRHADHRLGSGRQGDPLLDVRFQRHVRGGDVGAPRQELVHPQSRSVARRPRRLDGQCDEAGE